MCVAIIVPVDGKLPTLDTLQACETANRDGGGVAWTANGKVSWVKNTKLDAQDIVLLLEGIPPPYFVHFRIATAGGTNDDLCHPFACLKSGANPLQGEAPSVLMHNGHWHEWKDVLLARFRGRFPDGPWSDSRAMAWLVGLYGPGIMNLFDEKVAVLHGDRRVERFGHGWTERDGVWYSNTHWERPSVYDSKAWERTTQREVWRTMLDDDEREWMDEWQRDRTTPAVVSQYLRAEDSAVQTALAEATNDMLFTGANGNRKRNGKKR